MDYYHLLFFLINVAVSASMLTIKKLWRIRLTCCYQHAVTILSLFLFLNINVEFVLISLSCGMLSVSFLFTALIISFSRLKDSLLTGKNKLPLTPVRVFRNIWSHYGTTLILWLIMSNKNLKPLLKHQITSNLLIFVWLVLFGSKVKSIYDVPSAVNIRDLFPIFVGFGIVYNIVLWRVRVNSYDPFASTSTIVWKLKDILSFYYLDK